MKVAILNNYLHTRGGGEKLTLEYAEYFANRFPGAEVQVVSFQEDLPTIEIYARYFGMVLPKNVRLISIQSRINNFMRAILKIRLFSILFQTGILRRVCGTYDLFINITAASFCGAIARKNVYVLMFPFAGNSGSKPKRIISKILMRRAICEYDLVLSISEFTRLLAEDIYVLTQKSLTVYPYFEPSPKSLSKKGAKKNKKATHKILCVARFDNSGHRKRQDLLLRAFKVLSPRFPEIELQMIGSLNMQNADDMRYFEKLKDFVQTEGLRAELIANAPAEKVQDAFYGADIFWLGTGFYEINPPENIEKEHFGIVILEAMSNGLIPFTYSEGGVIELYEHQKSGFRCDNIEELAGKTVDYLLKSETEKNRMSHAARKRAELFRKSVFTSRLDQVLNGDFFAHATPKLQ